MCDCRAQARVSPLLLCRRLSHLNISTSLMFNVLSFIRFTYFCISERFYPCIFIFVYLILKTKDLKVTNMYRIVIHYLCYCRLSCLCVSFLARDKHFVLFRVVLVNVACTCCRTIICCVVICLFVCLSVILNTCCRQSLQSVVYCW